METIVSLFKVLFSEEVFTHVAPLCFLVDNLIVFYYLYGIRRYETKESAREGKKYFWKQLAWKSAYFILPLRRYEWNWCSSDAMIGRSA